MSADGQWQDADRISDEIMLLLRKELAKPQFNPTQMFAGQMLAMLAMLKSAPRRSMPVSLLTVEAAIKVCLAEILAERPRGRNGQPTS